MNTNNDKSPLVVDEGTFNIFGINVKCYILANGRRVIEEKSLVQLFEAMSDPNATINNDELEQFAKWARG